MHIEVQVALNFVISYLYNKLPRRRVNIFGEELEKALKDKFQGHWYPEKPFKGSAFRCLKTGDPTDPVLDRAARESGVPISDILENLPAELAVWIDPGEVSYRIGEKGAVKILYSESHEQHSENTSSADREVTKTFNPEAQCFRPIDTVNSSMSALSLSPKSSPHSSPSTSAPSPASANVAANNFIKNGVAPGNNSANAANTGGNATIGNSFLNRSHAPLTFTTATFAQTKFGSTKLKTNSKRSNSRMSPTEFSNYIKQRAIQQQIHHSHNNHNVPNTNGHLGSIGPVSPARSLSPNPLSVAIMNGAHNAANTLPTNGLSSDSYFLSPSNTNSNINSNHLYSPQQYGRSNLFDSNALPSAHYTSNGSTTNGMYSNSFGAIGSGGKYSPFLDSQNFYGLSQQQQQQKNGINIMGGGSAQHAMNGLSNGHLQSPHSTMNGGSGAGNVSIGNGIIGSGLSNATNPNLGNPSIAPIGSPNSVNSQDTTNSSTGSGSKIIDGMNSFYSNAGPYQHLLVAN